MHYLLVVPDTRKIFCSSVKYSDHSEETKIRKSPYPAVFLRYAQTPWRAGSRCCNLRESSQFDLEGEVVLVIGRDDRRIRAEDG